MSNSPPTLIDVKQSPFYPKGCHNTSCMHSSWHQTAPIHTLETSYHHNGEFPWVGRVSPKLACRFLTLIRTRTLAAYTHTVLVCLTVKQHWFLCEWERYDYFHSPQRPSIALFDSHTALVSLWMRDVWLFRLTTETEYCFVWQWSCVGVFVSDRSGSIHLAVAH